MPDLAVRQAARDLACALDPALFAERRLGFAPDPWQADLLRSGSRWTLVLCSRQAGKSTTAAVLALHTALHRPGVAGAARRRLPAPGGRAVQEVRRDARPARPGAGAERGQRGELHLRRHRLAGAVPAGQRGHGARLLGAGARGRGRGGPGAGRALPDDRPMLATGAGGPADPASTPVGQQGHFWQEWSEGGPDWHRVEVPAEQVPRSTRRSSRPSAGRWARRGSTRSTAAGSSAAAGPCSGPRTSLARFGATSSRCSRPRPPGEPLPLLARGRSRRGPMSRSANTRGPTTSSASARASPGQPVAVAVVGAEDRAAATAPRHRRLEVQWPPRAGAGRDRPARRWRSAWPTDLAAASTAASGASGGVAIVLDTSRSGTNLVEPARAGALPVGGRGHGRRREGDGRGAAPCRGASWPPGCCSRRSGAPSGARARCRWRRGSAGVAGFRSGRRRRWRADPLEAARREADDALVLAAGLCAWQAGARGAGAARRHDRPAAGRHRRLRPARRLAGMILGLDPGQRRDPAGLAVVDGFDVLHLERVLGPSYPAWRSGRRLSRNCRRLARLGCASGTPRVRRPSGPRRGGRATPVVVDATGVGRAVVDMLEALQAEADRGDAHRRRQGARPRPRGEPAAAGPVPAAAGGAGGRAGCGWPRAALTAPSWRRSCWRRAAGRPGRRAGARGTTAT